MSVPSEPVAPNSPKAREFFDPKSTLTPAIAGGSVLIITNALGMWFGFPRAETALMLSCIAGTVVVSQFPVAWGMRLPYWVLNSLLIFATSVGSNSAAAAIIPSTIGFTRSGGAHFFVPWL